MILLLFLIIVLLFFIHKKKNKPYYISLLILSSISFIIIEINPDLNEKYNLKQIIYLIDSLDFILYQILCLTIAVLLISIIFDRTKKNSLRIIFSLLTILGTLFIYLSLIGLILFLIKEPLKNDFEGYVYNDTKKPVERVKIIEGQSINNCVFTNKDGFFKLKRKMKINNESNLIFVKKEYKDTTVQIKSRYDRPPHRTFFLFLRNESDTLTMTR
ncbi:hypothetical protein [Flavobacterium sharifuzzamanii]|uniref:hypothetical protein n=1 Tax=Flavobacterium sharifuzzamanii TaxID=2211133 RepID=UPI000DAE1542|nr:hypothetical protein [Flavobacterium sharifuzzamanii]KAF2080642.1 hypothetical protein DMA14_10705 [Flavobacterium sharifuzzamanii]